MSIAQYRIQKEIERGFIATMLRWDDTQLLLEVSINSVPHEIRFTEKYPFHPPAVICAGEYSNLRILWPEEWRATNRINDIIQALITTEGSAAAVRHQPKATA
jgi:hypothetical protein